VRQRRFKTPIKGAAKSKDTEDGHPKQGQPETERYSLQIDRQSKRSFATPEAALAAAKEMKSRFPALQVSVLRHLEWVPHSNGPIEMTRNRC
jgi:hypothetical protein